MCRHVENNASSLLWARARTLLLLRPARFHNLSRATDGQRVRGNVVSDARGRSDVGSLAYPHRRDQRAVAADSAGLALCEVNDGGVYDGYSACTSGRLPAGVLARSAATDGSGWIRLGVAAPQVTSVTAVLPGGQKVRGSVESVHGLPYKLWAVSYPVTPAARLVFRDAAGREVTHLDTPGDQPAPSRPGHGGIALFRYAGDTMTAYRISGDRIGFWTGSDSMWSDVPVSESALSAIETGSTRTSTGSTPDDWFGYAPSGVARVALRLSDGRQFSSRTIPGWPGSGVVFWGPLTLPARIGLPGDIIVITYDAAGHILREVPYIFLG